MPVQCTPFVHRCQIGGKLPLCSRFGFKLAIYVVTMEKSQENNPETRLSSLETFDTRPVNGTAGESARQRDRVVVDHSSLKSPGSFKGWFKLIIYWTRELLWRRKFWHTIRREHD
jgi:hypothetical protein